MPSKDVDRITEYSFKYKSVPYVPKVPVHDPFPPVSKVDSLSKKKKKKSICILLYCLSCCESMNSKNIITSLAITVYQVSSHALFFQKKLCSMVKFSA